MAKVRAKFKVDSVTQTTMGGEIKLTPVTTGGPENERFFRYTPYGSLVIGTVNEEVIKEFHPGDEFYLDFTKVESEPEGDTQSEPTAENNV